jgi:hypothetical protein
MNYIKIVTTFNISCLFLYIILNFILMFRKIDFLENIFLELMLKLGECFFIYSKSRIVDFLYYNIVD